MRIYFFKNFWKKYFIEILVFFITVLMRMGLSFLLYIFLGNHAFVSFSDATGFYVSSAYNLINHHVFSIQLSPPFFSDSIRTPFYPLFLSSLFIFKASFFTVVLVQNILAGIGGVLIYKIGRKIFGKTVGLSACLIMAFEPMSIYWNNLLMSDFFFSFILLVSFYFFIFKKESAAALWGGVSVLVRPISLPLLLLWVSASSLLFKEKKFNWRQFIITLSIIFLVIMPWMVRNKILFNTFQVSSVGWYNTYEMHLKSFAYKFNISLQQPKIFNQQGELIDVYDVRYNQLYKKLFLQTVSLHKLEYVQFYSLNTAKVFLDNDYDYLKDYVILGEFPSLKGTVVDQILKVLVYIGNYLWYLGFVVSLTGIFLSSGVQRRWSFLFLFVIILNNLLVGMSTKEGSTDSRYFLPVASLFYLLVANGIRKTFFVLKQKVFQLNNLYSKRK